MGGIIIFAAISVPFLVLSDYDWRSVGVFGAAIACALLGFADDYTKIIKRRSLGLRGAHEARRDVAISLGLWLRRDAGGGPAETLRLRFVDARSTSASSTRCSSTSWSRGRRAP